MLGAPPVLLVNHALRALLARFLHRSLPNMAVLSNLEISDHRQIRMTSIIGSPEMSDGDAFFVGRCAGASVLCYCNTAVGTEVWPE